MNLSGIGALCKKKFNNVFCPIIVVMWLGNCSSQQVSNGGNHIGFWHIRRIYRDENMAPEVFMSFIFFDKVNCINQKGEKNSRIQEVYKK